jgi:hypothetical protein
MLFQTDASLKSDVWRLDLAIGHKDNVDIADRVARGLYKPLTLGNDLKKLCLALARALNEAQTEENASDDSVGLEHRHPDVGEQVVYGDLAQVCEATPEVFSQPHEVLGRSLGVEGVNVELK